LQAQDNSLLKPSDCFTYHQHWY